MNYPKLLSRYEEFLAENSLNDEYDKNVFFPFIEDCLLASDSWEDIPNRGDKVYDGIISDLAMLDRKKKLKKLMEVRMRKLGIDKDDVGIIKYLKK